jgi:pilus assembly protein CpaB
MMKRQEIAELLRDRKTLVLALAGGALGLAASVMAYHYLEREEAQLRDQIKEEQGRNQIAVVVAKADLPVGTTVSVNNMATRQVPRDYVYPETVLPAAFESVTGQTLVKPLAKGQPLLRGYLSEGGAAGLADKIKPGRRAVAINVDEVSSLNGLIMPGDQIDLMLSSRSNGTIVPLLQGVKVLATGAQVAPKAGSQPGEDKFGLRYATMTLDVAPKDSERVILAREQGTLTAVLRGRGSETEAALAPLQADEMVAANTAGASSGNSITYLVRGQPAGIATAYKVPLGMSVPQAGGAALQKGTGGPAANAPDQGKERQSGEQGKQ